MIRIITEQIQFSESEIESVHNFQMMLYDFLCSIKKEDAFPTLSDLYLDTEHLLNEVDNYMCKYGNFIVD